MTGQSDKVVASIRQPGLPAAYLKLDASSWLTDVALLRPALRDRTVIIVCTFPVGAIGWIHQT